MIDINFSIQFNLSVWWHERTLTCVNKENQKLYVIWNLDSTTKLIFLALRSVNNLYHRRNKDKLKENIGILIVRHKNTRVIRFLTLASDDI